MFYTPNADKPVYVVRFDKMMSEWVIYSIVRRYYECDTSEYDDIENFVASFSDEDVANNMANRLTDMEEQGEFR